jgi:hypothetical protein
MSMINCEECGHPVDSDSDPGCFEGERVLCQECRADLACELERGFKPWNI